MSLWIMRILIHVMIRRMIYRIIILSFLLLGILQNQELNSNINPRKIERETRKEEPSSPFLKRILVVDDDPDITLTFKIGLEHDKSFEEYAYTDPLEALLNFKPHFYDLLLADINMPKMNGFE